MDLVKIRGSAMISPIEALPSLLLNRICDFLDDESRLRHSLRAFASTSKRCRDAAEAQQFSQVEVRVLHAEELEGTLRRWNELLIGGRNRHVRRLKISWAATEDERKEDENYTDWDPRPYFHMHAFCRPTRESIRGNGAGSLSNHPQNWAPLGQFIAQLPGLRDIIWEAGWNVLLPVLSTISEKGCRLHLHSFDLPSLVYYRDNIQSVSPEDYTLCTSPSVFSMVVKVGSFGDNGRLDYTKEAVMQMVSGLAPNLAHLCLFSRSLPGELAINQAIALGRPPWKGFFPITTENEAGTETDTGHPHRCGKLQSLVFTSYVPLGIDHWARLTDFSKLRCLFIPWSLKNVVALAGIAGRGDFIALDKLRLSCFGDEDIDESEEAQSALNRLFESLRPLERLELSNYISPETFDIIVRRHGENLHTLSVNPFRDIGNDSRKPLVSFSAPVLQQLAGKFPKLTNLSIPIARTRGDEHEIAIYRALSKFSRLEHLRLHLMYSIGPDEEFWDDEKDGAHPFSHSYMEPEDIPPAYLREAYTNIAMDSTLALSIFNLISSGGSLRYLKLTLRHKVGFLSPGRGFQGTFQTALRWFGRPWVCTREDQGEIMVREIDKVETVKCGREWEGLLSDKEQCWSEEIYKELFGEIWPQKTADWQNDWESLPLSYEEAA